MCYEYSYEKKLREQAEQKAQRDVEEAIRRARETKPRVPASEPAVLEKEPA